MLTPSDYRDFSLRYMERIVNGITREADGRRVPVILFTKGGGQWLDRMAETGCDALGVDWTTDLADARRLTGGKVALQGNLDPARCTRHPIASAARSVACWRAMAPGRAMSSISATASIRT